MELWLALLVLAVITGIALLRRRKVTLVYAPSVGLLYRNGRFERELPPGRYRSLDLFNRTHIVTVSTAPLPVTLAEITVMTADQFSFRLGLAPVVKVIDARAYQESRGGVVPSEIAMFMPAMAAHPVLQPAIASAALQATGGLTLREIFAAPQAVVDDIFAAVEQAIPGALIERVMLTSMTLPPETRKMFTEVERTRMQAEAALERARGEQASLRSLANAARLIKDNPALANLRFLQMVEQAPGPKTIVMGNVTSPAFPEVGAA